VTAGTTAQAQVQSGPGFFGYVDGMYLLPSGPGSQFTSGGFGGQGHRGDGWGLDAKFGYSFGDLDVAFGGSYHEFSAGKSANGVPLGTFRNTDTKVWFLEGEIGWKLRGPGWGVRPSLGVRYERITANHAATALAFTERTRTWGIGPHIGVDASLRLTDSLSLFGGIDTSFLFGKARSTSIASASDSRMIWQIGAKLGLDWEFAPLWHIAAGYRLNHIDGAMFRTLFGPGGITSGRSAVFEHGPFVRLTYNWGAPPPGAPAMAPTPTTQKSFIVFFDFDRANLTPTALQTISQAAAQAKSGKTTRIDVTGHADRSGSDAYNMALSLRRANAVRDQLVRYGIAANQIVVAGRGESEPMVPTADGVREPQNRRVVIVLQ
jgi:outer membrane protein OmpA-like peptidoglycan-associated protein